jgi:hypothetical protein
VEKTAEDSILQRCEERRKIILSKEGSQKVLVLEREAFIALASG